jgi:hypothetical protein
VRERISSELEEVGELRRRADLSDPGINVVRADPGGDHRRLDGVDRDRSGRPRTSSGRTFVSVDADATGAVEADAEAAGTKVALAVGAADGVAAAEQPATTTAKTDSASRRHGAGGRLG